MGSVHGAPAVVECVKENGFPDREVWHACKGEGTDTFQPILCSPDEGINMPGPRRATRPTCTRCVAALRRGRA